MTRLADDPKALATVARRSEHAPVRMAALGRLQDAEELASTALKSSFRDVATAALERVTDRAAIKAIATRAANPAAARRARVILRGVEEQDGGGGRRPGRRAGGGAGASPGAGRAGARGRTRGRRALASPARPIASRRSSSGGRARAPTRSRICARDSIRPSALPARSWPRSRSSVPPASSGSVRLPRRWPHVAHSSHAAAALGGDTNAEAQAVLVAEWEGLPVVEHPEGAQLQAEFESALRGLERKRQDEANLGDRLTRLVELATALETLAADPHYPASRDVRQRARRVRQDAQAAIAGVSPEPRWQEAVARVTAAETALAAREQAWRDAQNAEAEQLKRRAQQAVQRMADMLKVEAPTLKALERAVADSLSLEADLGHEPVDPDRQDLRRQLASLRELLQPKAAELREADDWQRWANAGVQEQLIAKMTALGAEADANVAFRKMRELQEQWKAVASAPRDQAEHVVDPVPRGRAGRARARGADARRAARAASGAPRAQGRVVREGRSAGRLHRLDRHGRCPQGAAGRVEDHRRRRRGATSRPCGIGSAPPATASSRAGRTT